MIIYNQIRRYYDKVLKIQGIHKRIVQLQKLTRNLFLTFHGHNVPRQQRQLSKFDMRYQWFRKDGPCMVRLF